MISTARKYLNMTAIDPKLSPLLARLEAAGKRVTPQRVAVCEALLAHGDHRRSRDLAARARRAPVDQPCDGL